MQNKIILVTTDSFGTGNDSALGENVMETYFTVLKQQSDLPAAIFFMNRGVYCLTEQSLCSLHLKEMEDKGVKVFGCKTCVDHYNVEKELAAGEISGMAHFVELSAKYEVITIA
ncbi:transcriptional regulator [Fictibacillus phosphorivorans]|uniref:Transcriptional regulator n=1 Tax=Fictibacillus phosphorivorans TaxID=1221500 RepID=A0A165N7J0_9BACL|nr:MULTISPECIES: DsrE family protein [Fictibacillus]KZE64914.1 transcriptional regulator [Fictibacillus phosphorivorans]MDM5318003.1 DsrE family protein [Fictibacillus sp. b24]